jgi:hypothetical protein
MPEYEVTVRMTSTSERTYTVSEDPGEPALIEEKARRIALGAASMSFSDCRLEVIDIKQVA